jgi:hypothetical protein
VTVRGWVEETSALVLAAVLAPVLEHEPATILVELGPDVAFVDCGGALALRRVVAGVERRGARVVIRASTPAARHVLRLAGLGRHLDRDLDDDR